MPVSKLLKVTLPALMVTLVACSSAPKTVDSNAPHYVITNTKEFTAHQLMVSFNPPVEWEMPEEEWEQLVVDYIETYSYGLGESTKSKVTFLEEGEEAAGGVVISCNITKVDRDEDVITAEVVFRDLDHTKRPKPAKPAKPAKEGEEAPKDDGKPKPLSEAKEVLYKATFTGNSKGATPQEELTMQGRLRAAVRDVMKQIDNVMAEGITAK